MDDPITTVRIEKRYRVQVPFLKLMTWLKSEGYDIPPSSFLMTDERLVVEINWEERAER